MKLVQNGTITATSSSRCARGGWREMKYASEKPSTAQTAVAPSERKTLRSRLCEVERRGERAVVGRRPAEADVERDRVDRRRTSRPRSAPSGATKNTTVRTAVGSDQQVLAQPQRAASAGRRAARRLGYDAFTSCHASSKQLRALGAEVVVELDALEHGGATASGSGSPRSTS